MKIVTCYQSTEKHRQQIEQACPGCTVLESNNTDIPKDIFAAEILFGHIKAPVDWPKVVEAGKLRLIQSSAAGLDHCLVPAVIDSSIPVCSASGVFADQVAEQAMSLLYGLVRKINRFIKAQQRKSYVRLPTDDLHTKRIGIVGLGGNGQRIAQLLRPAVRTIQATDYFADQLKMDWVEKIYQPDQLDLMLETSDVLIVTAPLVQETFHLIGHNELQRLPRGSYVVNVGRGPVVDERALIDALESEHLAGVGLDVAEVEPLPAESPLWEHENAIVTPHVGAQSSTRNDDITDLFCENLRRLESGQLINVVEKTLGFPRPECRYDPLHDHEKTCERSASLECRNFD